MKERIKGLRVFRIRDNTTMAIFPRLDMARAYIAGLISVLGEGRYDLEECEFEFSSK